MYFIRDFAMQMNIKKALNWDCVLVIPLQEITQKTNFYEYKIGLYARHPHMLLD